MATSVQILTDVLERQQRYTTDAGDVSKNTMAKVWMVVLIGEIIHIYIQG
jgi:hypothetical protein